MEDIKIVLLKTRQQVITKLSELRDENDNPFCFLMEVPLIVDISPQSTPEDLKIAFSQLMPFSSTPAFRIPFDHVITIGDPKQGVLEKYIEIVKPYYPIDGGAEPNTIESKEETENDN
jgi:hypothetical protein